MTDLIGQTVKYRGARVQVVEEATGFIKKTSRKYWARVIDKTGEFEPGEEITISEKHILKQI